MIRSPISSKGSASLWLTSPDPQLSEPPSQAKLLTGATSSSILPSTSALHPPAQESMTPRELSPPSKSTNTPTVSPPPPLTLSSTALPRPHHGLTESEPIRSLILYPNISVNISTSRLDLHFSSDTTAPPSPDTLSNPSSRYSVRVKWLQGVEIRNVGSEATDAGGLGFDTEMEFHHTVTCKSAEVYLKRGDDFVSINSALEEPR